MTNSNVEVGTDSAQTLRPTSKEVHIDENCENLTGHHKGAVFYNCLFKKLSGLVLEGCALNQSRFLTDDIKDALNFTLSLNCLSFDNVEFSPLLFDLFLCLAIKSKGNTEKRRQLIEVVGRDRVRELLMTLKELE
jgi:hypothetical protein